MASGKDEGSPLMMMEMLEAPVTKAARDDLETGLLEDAEASCRAGCLSDPQVGTDIHIGHR